jgi:hypothetical protein
MLISFFNIDGIIDFESVPEGTTVNQTFCVEVLRMLSDAVRRKRGVVERSLTDSSSRQRADKFFASSVAVFCQEKASLLCIIRRTLRTGSSCLLARSNTQWACWEESVSLTLRTLNHLREKIVRTILFRILKSILNNGRSAGNTVKNWREITLKNSRFLISAVLKINFY